MKGPVMVARVTRDIALLSLRPSLNLPKDFVIAIRVMKPIAPITARMKVEAKGIRVWNEAGASAGTQAS